MSEDIIAYVLTTPYYNEEEDGDVTENFYGGGMGGIRTGITAMKKAGYLTLYPKNELGEPLGIKPRRPYQYWLTATGLLHCANPHIKREHREQRISIEAYRFMQELLLDEPLFQEAVREYVKTNQVPKLNVIRQKAPIIRNPRIEQGKTEKIVIENPDDYSTESEIANNEIKAVQELKAKINQLEADHTATIKEYEKYVRELESTLSQSEIETVKKFERNLSREEKIQMRYALAVEYANNNYYLDEYFFKVWKGDYIIAVLKKLMELGQMIAPECIDIFSRNSDLYKRRQSRIKRTVSGEEILSCEFFIKDFTDSGVVIGSPYLEEDKNLKW